MKAISTCFVIALWSLRLSPVFSSQVTSHLSIKYVGNKTFSNTSYYNAIWSRVGCLSLCTHFPNCDGISFNKTDKFCKTFSGISNLDGSGFFASAYGSPWEMMHITSIERILINNGYKKYSDERWVKYYPYASGQSISLKWPAALNLCQQPFSSAIMFVPRNYDDLKFLQNITGLQQKSWGAADTWSGLVFDPNTMTGGVMPPVWMDGTPFNSYGNNITKTGSGNHPQAGNLYGFFKYTTGMLQMDFASDSRRSYICQVIPPIF